MIFPQAVRAWIYRVVAVANLALVAGSLSTKYLNEVFVIPRGDYTHLPMLMVVVMVIGFITPVAAILAFGRRLN